MLYEFPNGIEIEVSGDDVRISHRDSGELVIWIKDEWQEDDTVTPAIADWIAFAALNGAGACHERLGYRMCMGCEGWYLERHFLEGVCPECRAELMIEDKESE